MTVQELIKAGLIDPLLSVEGIISYAAFLGYRFTEEEAEDIIATSYDSWTVEEAVHSYLDELGE